ncbi:hypothetical protein C4569_02285 [Candidatus Parcubacteria bacterium]|nr:MAG: hypothetical protein C4569_02285 [Candidatus Parcubacteria bacterium]
MADVKLANFIIKTIVYFDIFDYPLTILEAWKWLYQGTVDKVQGTGGNGQYAIYNVQLARVIEELNQLVEENKLETRNGFYFLPGRSNLIRLRLERYNIAEIKFKKALRLAKFLRFVPYIKMVAVCNTLGYSNSRDTSDIDFFIITEKKRIWLARFCSVFFLKVLDLRPKTKNSKDKFCLSFFISEENLNLEKVALDDRDIYFHFWLSQLVPVFGVETYNKFLAENLWKKNYLPNFISYNTAVRRLARPGCDFIKTALLFLTPDFLEAVIRYAQLAIMPQKLKAMANKNTNVLINDTILKFHDNDRRIIYRELWERKLSALA